VIKTEKLVVVPGATGDLGRGYLNYYSRRQNTICIGLSRKDENNPINSVQYLKANLEEPILIKEQIQRNLLERVPNILLIHPVGKFKFERDGTPESDNDCNGIDDEVQSSNITTFQNIVRYLLEKRKEGNISLIKLVAFGSISDPYGIPWWGSYSKSKLMLRRYIRELTRIEPMVQGIFVNLSSINTSNERKLRPFADTTYWLSPNEVVAKSVPIIENSRYQYLELDIFKPCPNYHENYYKEFDALKKEWLKDRGRE